MKRKHCDASNPIRTRVIDSSQLPRIRGGDGLGITVVIGTRTANDMQNQHNEALVSL